MLILIWRLEHAAVTDAVNDSGQAADDRQADDNVYTPHSLVPFWHRKGSSGSSDRLIIPTLLSDQRFSDADKVFQRCHQFVVTVAGPDKELAGVLGIYPHKADIAYHTTIGGYDAALLAESVR